jgi:hypothetical protein
MMRKAIHTCLFALLISFAAHTSAAESATPAKEKEVKLTAKGVEFFESKIRPVLTQRCYSCHSNQAKEVKGGLLLDTRDALRKGGESGAAVVPGDVGESLLIQAIKHETYEMPPGDKLADNIIADFEEWVRMGAPDPRTNKTGSPKKVSLADARSFWSFKKPVRSTAPAVKNAAWPRSEIDSFVLAKLEASGLQPVADADRVTLIRRLYFDLTGLPPTPSEIDAFVSDRSSEAVSLVVDRLLESPQFGERWGRHWLDVARYGESTGKERNVAFPYAWRYRDYVIDAFNKDKPYDRFVREQISGDLLHTTSVAERNESLVATGFLAIGTKSLNERNREQYLMDVADEQIDVATRAVLGMTVACARCHDHKFDPIAQTDYYAVAGIFRSTEVLAGVRPGNNKTGYDGDFASMASGEAKPKRTPEQNAEIEKIADELKEARAFQARLKSVKEQAGGKGAKAKGKGPSIEKLKKAGQRIEQRISQLESQLEQAKETPAGGGIPVMAVQDSKNPANCKVNIRGEVKDLGPEVQRGIPVVLAFDRSSKFNTDNSGRTQLASWLVSRDNPLTARVMSNRIWAHLFGRGIVESVDNFGTLGDEPTHPELLDYLAVRFMENGWSVKTLIKEIVLSRTYQLSADHNEANYAIDPDNKMVWRMNRRRLEAEPIRDAILAISGKLDLKRPEGSLIQNAAVEIGRGKRPEPNLANFLHRSVYLPYVRSRMPEFLTLFDAADPSLIVGQRDVTTVAPQALFMMNSPLVMEHATLAAKRILDQPSKSDDDRIDYAYRLIVGHYPTVEQRRRSLEYLANVQKLASESESSAESAKEAALASLCQTLIASAEFRYVY